VPFTKPKAKGAKLGSRQQIKATDWCCCRKLIRMEEQAYANKGKELIRMEEQAYANKGKGK
jgi:hypothetical protein